MRYTIFMKLFSFFKHMFIPHQGNDFKPHFFREASLFIILIGSIFLLGSSFFSSLFLHTTEHGAVISSSVLIDLTNEERVRANEVPLLRNKKLEQAARLKGEDMATKEYFAHDSPEGITPWHWFQQAGYAFLYAGENLAINFTNSGDVEKAWLDSPKHRDNIMNDAFQEIGIAVVPGVYNNTPTRYVVQMFGTPSYGELVREAEASSTQGVSTTLTRKEKKIQDSLNITKSLQSIGTTHDIAAVKNLISITDTPNTNMAVPLWYSTWSDRLMFNLPYYVDDIYTVLFSVIVLALITMIVVEIRKQHVTHVLYGVSILLLLQLFMYINQSFF